MAYTWAYDGGNGDTGPGGVLSVTISDPTPGWQYRLTSWDWDSTPIIVTAPDSNPLTLTITDYGVPANAGEMYIENWLETDGGVGSFPGTTYSLNGQPLSSAIVKTGTSGVATPYSVTASFDGLTFEITLTVPFGLNVGVWVENGGATGSATFQGSGNPQTFSFDVGITNPELNPDDHIWIDVEIRGLSGNTSYWDEVWNAHMFLGSSTIYEADGGVPPGPNFSIDVNPSIISVNENTNTDVTVSTTAISGDTENIVLSGSGPSGITVTFDNPNIVAGGSAVATIHVPAGTVAGSYMITIDAVGDIYSHSTTITTQVVGENVEFGGAVALDEIARQDGTIRICKTDVPVVAGTGQDGWSYNGSNTVTFGPFTVPAGATTMGIYCSDPTSSVTEIAVTPGDTITLTRNDIGTSVGKPFSAVVTMNNGRAVQFYEEGNAENIAWSTRFIYGTANNGFGTDLFGEYFGAFGSDMMLYARWYTYTNHFSVPGYFRFDAQCFSKTGGVNSILEFCWGMFMMRNGQLLPIDLIDLYYDGFKIYDFYNVDYESFCFDFTNTTTKLSDWGEQGGILLQPGETVYLVIGFNTYYPTDVVDGCVDFGWSLTGYAFQPVTDRRPVPPGESIPQPEHAQLDYSGFDTALPNIGPIEYGYPRSYAYFNGKHYTAAIVSLPADNYHSLNTGELGIWELNPDGTQSNFWQIYTFQNHGVSYLVGHDNGEYVSGFTGKLVTDGNDLWFVSANRYSRPCPFGPFVWNPFCLAIYHFNGGGWDLIDFLDATTSNNMFFGGPFGGSGEFHSFDADARDGVLHCVMSEQGTQAGYNTATVFDNDPDYASGGSTAEWQTAIQYGAFSAGAKLSQSTPFVTNLNTADMGVLTEQIHDDANIVAIRATPAGPRIFMVRTNKYPATTGFQFAFDIFDETGALLKTVDHAILDTVGAAAESPFTPSSMILGGFSISKNAFVDPFDESEVYAIMLVVNAFNTRMTLRFPSDDVTNIKYWLDDPAMSNGGPFGASYQGTTVKPGGDTNNLGLWYPLSGSFGGIHNIYRWEPCYLQTVQEDSTKHGYAQPDGSSGWLTWRHSYPDSPFGGYPNVTMLSDDVWWDDTGDNYYFIGQSSDATGSGVFGTGQSIGLFKTHILKNFLCHVGDVLILIQPSIFWFFKDGEWHNAGNDPVYNLWFYRNGEWRSHLFDGVHALHGQLEGTWQK